MIPKTTTEGSQAGYRLLPSQNSRTRFLAWHSRRSLDLSEVKRRLGLIKEFSPKPGTQEHVFVGERGHIGMVLWAPQVKGISDLWGTVEGHLVGSSYPPFGISRLLNLTDSLQLKHMRQLARLLIDDPSKIQELSPPTSILSARQGGGLDLFNDMRGLVDFFAMTTTREGFTGWSSDPCIPLLFALEEPIEDLEAAAQRAFWSYYPHTLSPLANAPRVAGASHIHADDSPAAPRTVRSNLTGQLLGDARTRSFDAKFATEEFLDSLSRTVAEAQAFFDGRMTMGLSGGRDSRLLLAGLIQLDRYRDVRLFTRATMGSDGDLGQKVFEASAAAGYDLNWRRIPGKKALFSASQDHEAFAFLPAYRATPLYGENPLLDRFIYAFHLKNGQTMPGGYFAAPSSRVDQAVNAVSISGVAGEVLRASRYKDHDLARGVDRFLSRFAKRKFGIGTRLGKRISPLRPFTERTLDLSHDSWRRYLTEAEENHIDGFHKADYFAISAQQSRRIGLGRIFNVVAPLASPRLMLTAFGMTAQQRTNNTYHRELISLLSPWLKDIEFSHQIPVPTRERRRDNSGMPTLFSEEGLPGFKRILSTPELWEDVYDRASIETVFKESHRNILNAYQKDRLACQLAWRVAQARYVSVLSLFIASARQRIEA